jgi:hypothetical protein
MDFRTAVNKTLLGEDFSVLTEEMEQLIVESYEFDDDNIAGIIEVYEELQNIVEALPKAAYVSAMRNATDPEGDGKIDSDKIVARAKKHHGDKFAKDLDSGAMKMHFPRPGRNVHVASDKLKSRSPSRVTQSGKANKQDISALKNKIKNKSY